MCIQGSSTAHLAVGVGVGREVTPAASQASVIKVSALVRSSPVQVDSTHVWTLSMNTELSQRHVKSVEAQPSRGASTMHVIAHARG